MSATSSDSKAQPTTLLLDIGGVLVGVDHRRTVETLAHLSQRDNNAVVEAINDSGLNRSFELGRISATTFYEAVSERLTLTCSREEFDAAWNAMVVGLDHTPALLEELSEEFETYILSNTNPIHVAHLDQLFHGWRSFTAGMHFSYEINALKPDQAFFHGAISRFDLNPSRCLFFDDTFENVASARTAGIPAVTTPPGGLTRALIQLSIPTPRQ